MLHRLHGTTPEADEELKAFVKAFKAVSYTHLKTS